MAKLESVCQFTKCPHVITFIRFRLLKSSKRSRPLRRQKVSSHAKNIEIPQIHCSINSTPPCSNPHQERIKYQSHTYRFCSTTQPRALDRQTLPRLACPLHNHQLSVSICPFLRPSHPSHSTPSLQTPFSHPFLPPFISPSLPSLPNLPPFPPSLLPFLSPSTARTPYFLPPPSLPRSLAR